MREIIKRLNQWKNGKKSFPYGIELSPTLKCNLNCLFCWRHSVKKINLNNELSLLTYERIIEEAKRLNVQEMKIIGGGEATCRKDLIKIMELIKKNNMYGYICTNGTIFKQKEIKRLFEIRWDHIKISLHGPNKQINDYLTKVKGSFDKVIKNIELFKEYKDHRRKNKPYMEIGVVLVNKNYNKIIDFVKLGSRLGVNAVFLEPITVYSKEGKKLKLNQEQIKVTKNILKKVKRLANKYKIENNFDNFISLNLIEKTNIMSEVILSGNKKTDFFNLPCYEPFYRMGIRTDGVVGPCGFFDEMSPENIKNKSLKEIWFGDYFEKRRKHMLENKLSDYCKKCCTTLVINNFEIRKQLKRMIH